MEAGEASAGEGNQGVIGFAFILAVAASTPYKLVLVANDHPIVIDYPSKERCEAAKEAAQIEARRQLDEGNAPASSPDGNPFTKYQQRDPIIKPALRIAAICIPG